MKGMDCEQLAIDQNWSLTRTNACHISVQNEEMGELRDQMTKMNGNIQYLMWSQGVTTAIWIFIAIFVGKKALSQMWGKNK